MDGAQRTVEGQRKDALLLFFRQAFLFTIFRGVTRMVRWS